MSEDVVDKAHKAYAAVLAAGKGTRMAKPGSSEPVPPKAMAECLGLTLLQWVTGAIEKSLIQNTPIVVIGHKKEEVIAHLGPRYLYAEQIEQKGTGHAVKHALEKLPETGTVLILYADMPLITADTINSLMRSHWDESPAITMATVTVDDFTGDSAGFDDFGRVIADANGQVLRIVEKVAATDGEKSVKTVNPSIFCFDIHWLRANIDKIGTDNPKEEYFLTDLVEIAIGQQERVVTVPIAPTEAIGINDPQQLNLAERLLNQRLQTLSPRG